MSNPAPIDVGGCRQLFIDGRFVERSEGLCFTLEKPHLQRENLLPPTKPWESGRAGVWSSILRYGGKFRFWYDAYEWDEDNDTLDSSSHCHCYAFSEDGVHFEKPELGVIEVNRSTNNNVAMRSVEGGPVFIDPFAPTEKRFRTITRWQPKRGSNWEELEGTNQNQLFLFSSPDGIHWKRNSVPLFNFWLGGPQSVVWDDRIGKWVFYLRAHVPFEVAGRTESRRCHTRIEVEQDALEKTIPISAGKLPEEPEKQIALVDQLPVVLDVDEKDQAGAQFYLSNVFKYGRAENVYIALIPIWYSSSQGDVPASDRLEVHVAFSRDGITWERPHREPFIPPGLIGTVTGGNVYTVQNPIEVGEELWIYYHGWPQRHMSGEGKKGKNHMARAILPLDRFVAVAPEKHETGGLVTPSIRFKGSRLLVNVNAGGAGNLRTGLETASGSPIDGFTLEDSEPIFGNTISAEVKWKGSPDLRQLAGQAVRIKFRLTACRLYAFQFTGPA